MIHDSITAVVDLRCIIIICVCVNVAERPSWKCNWRMAEGLPPGKKAISVSWICQASRSSVWQHFKLQPARKDGKQLVSCNMCPVALTYHGATSNMHGHIQRKHSAAFRLKVEEDGSADSDVPLQKQRTLEPFAISRSRKLGCTARYRDRSYAAADNRWSPATEHCATI